jgi:hypothetical protein
MEIKRVVPNPVSAVGSCFFSSAMLTYAYWLTGMIYSLLRFVLEEADALGSYS